jgi:hypothetical protein
LTISLSGIGVGGGVAAGAFVAAFVAGGAELVCPFVAARPDKEKQAVASKKRMVSFNMIESKV